MSEPEPQPTRRSVFSSKAARNAGWVGGGVALLGLFIWIFSGNPEQKTETIYTNGHESQTADQARIRDVLWTQPTVLFPEADDELDRYDPTITDDGLTLVFVTGLPREGADLYFSTRAKPTDEWSEPKPLAGSNSPADELSPALSTDGRFLFFASDREGGQGGYDLWVASRSDDEWSLPVNLGGQINSPFDELDPAIRRPMDEPGNTGGRLFPKGLYFASNRPDDQTKIASQPRWRGTARVEYPAQLENFDLFLAALEQETLASGFSNTSSAPPAEQQKSVGSPESPVESLLKELAAEAPEKSGEAAPENEAHLPSTRHPWTFSQPARLGFLNTAQRDAMPSLTALGDYLYWASNRPGGEGGFDILRARWHPDSHRTPVNIGRPLNTAANETDPVLFNHGHEMIFSSDRAAGGEVPTYQLFHSRTIEVISVTQKTPLPSDSAASGFWAFLDANKWWIMLLLLALLALLALLKNFLSEESRRTLSLLQKCLLTSLALHILLALLLSLLMLTHAAYEQIKEEKVVEITLNPNSAAQQQLTTQVREAVTELPPAKANLPNELPSQPASASQQSPNATPSRPVEIQPSSKPTPFAVESRPVQPSAVLPETLAQSRPVELPQETQPEPEPIRMQMAAAQAQANAQLANAQAQQPVNPSANPAANANPQTASTLAASPNQLPSMTLPVPALPEMAQVNPQTLSQSQNTPTVPQPNITPAQVQQNQSAAQAQPGQANPQANPQSNTQAASQPAPQTVPQPSTAPSVQTAQVNPQQQTPAAQSAEAAVLKQTIPAAQASNTPAVTPASPANLPQQQDTARAQANSAMAAPVTQNNARAVNQPAAQSNPQLNSPNLVARTQEAKTSNAPTAQPTASQNQVAAVNPAQPSAQLPQAQATAAPTQQSQAAAQSQAIKSMTKAMGPTAAQAAQQSTAKTTPQATQSNEVQVKTTATASQAQTAQPAVANSQSATVQSAQANEQLPVNPAESLNAPQQQTAAQSHAGPAMAQANNQSRTDATGSQAAVANPQKTSNPAVGANQAAQQPNAPAANPANAQPQQANIQTASAQDNLPRAQSASGPVQQQQSPAQAQAGAALAQAGGQSNSQPTATDSTATNPQAMTSQNVSPAAVQAEAASMNSKPANGQAATAQVQAASASSNLPQAQAPAVNAAQQQAKARTEGAKSLAAAQPAQGPQTAASTPAQSTGPQVGKAAEIQSAKADSVNTNSMAQPVEGNSPAAGVTTAQAQGNLPQSNTSTVIVKANQSKAQGQGPRNLQTAPNSNVAVAIAQTQEGSDPKAVSTAKVQTQKAAAANATANTALTQARNSNEQLTAASGGNPVTEASQPDSNVKLPTTQAGRQDSAALTSASNQRANPDMKPSSAVTTSRPQANGLSPQISASMQAANGAVTNAVPATLKAAAGQLNLAQVPSTVKTPNALPNQASVGQANAQAQAGQQLADASGTQVQSTTAKAPGPNTTTPVTQSLTTPTVQQSIKAAAVQRTGPVKANAPEGQVKMAQVQPAVPGLNLAAIKGEPLAQVEATVSAGNDLNSAKSRQRMAAANVAGSGNKVSPRVVPLLAAIGMSPTLAPTAEALPSPGSAKAEGALNSAQLTAPNLQPTKFEPAEGAANKSAAAQVAGKNLQAARGAANIKATAVTASAPAGGAVTSQELVQSKATPKLGTMQLAALPVPEMTVDPVTLEGSDSNVVLPDMKVKSGVTFHVPQDAVDPLILRKNPKVRLDIIEELGGSDETEKAVRRALDWFTRNQEKDGHWRGDAGHTTAATGSAMLAYMGWGAKHTEPGPYQVPLAKAVEWMLRVERKGDLRWRGNMYDHGIAAIALAEAYSLTKDPRLRAPVERMVAFTIKAQNPKTGGWRYRTYEENPRDKGDLSVTGWQLMALRSAEIGGIPVPKVAYDRVKNFMKFVGTGRHGGDYRYFPRFDKNVTMVSEGLFCQQLLHVAPTDNRMKESVELILRELPNRRSTNYYYWYYGSLAMHQTQGPAWEQWNNQLRPILLRNQVRNGGREDGSWDPSGKWGPEAGRCVVTAMATLSLEVYYRYLPLSSPEWIKTGK